MKQFYETYQGQPKLSTQSRELNWSHNLAIIGRSQSGQEREFYLQATISGRWRFSSRKRQMDGSLYERALTGPPRLSPALVTRYLTGLADRATLQAKLDECYALAEPATYPASEAGKDGPA